MELFGWQNKRMGVGKNWIFVQVCVAKSNSKQERYRSQRHVTSQSREQECRWIGADEQVVSVIE